MSGWLAGVDRTTMRVMFITAIITLLLLPWIALDMLWAGGTWELATWAKQSLMILWFVVTIPPMVAAEAVWGIGDVVGDVPIMYGALLFMLAYWVVLATLIALLCAMLFSTAYVLIRRMRERRSASTAV